MCALQGYMKNEAKWPMYPKLHLLHEVSFELRRQATYSPVCYNPAIECCAMDEKILLVELLQFAEV